MEVIANGDPVAVDESSTVADLLRALGVGAKWVIVERNGEPVPRRELESTRLAAGDRVELVRAVSGG